MMIKSEGCCTQNGNRRRDSSKTSSSCNGATGTNNQKAFFEFQFKSGNIRILAFIILHETKETRGTWKSRCKKIRRELTLLTLTSSSSFFFFFFSSVCCCCWYGKMFPRQTPRQKGEKIESSEQTRFVFSSKNLWDRKKFPPILVAKDKVVE